MSVSMYSYRESSALAGRSAMSCATCAGIHPNCTVIRFGPFSCGPSARFICMAMLLIMGSGASPAWIRHAIRASGNEFERQTVIRGLPEPLTQQTGRCSIRLPPSSCTKALREEFLPRIPAKYGPPRARYGPEMASKCAAFAGRGGVGRRRLPGGVLCRSTARCGLCSCSASSSPIGRRAKHPRIPQRGGLSGRASAFGVVLLGSVPVVVVASQPSRVSNSMVTTAARYRSGTEKRKRP